ADVGADLRRFRDRPKLLDAVLKTLVDAGVIRTRSEARDPSQRGPKPTTTYDVHPQFLGAPGITGNSANWPTSPAPEANNGIAGNSWRAPESQSADQSPDLAAQADSADSTTSFELRESLIPPEKPWYVDSAGQVSRDRPGDGAIEEGDI